MSGRTPGDDYTIQRGRLNPYHRLFRQVTPRTRQHRPYQIRTKINLTQGGAEVRAGISALMRASPILCYAASPQWRAYRRRFPIARRPPWTPAELRLRAGEDHPMADSWRCIRLRLADDDHCDPLIPRSQLLPLNCDNSKNGNICVRSHHLRSSARVPVCVS